MDVYGLRGIGVVDDPAWTIRCGRTERIGTELVAMLDGQVWGVTRFP